MDRTKTEQEFLDHCISKGKGKLPIAMDLLELITDFIEVDRKKQLLIHSVVVPKGTYCECTDEPMRLAMSLTKSKN